MRKSISYLDMPSFVEVLRRVKLDTTYRPLLKEKVALNKLLNLKVHLPLKKHLHLLSNPAWIGED